MVPTPQPGLAFAPVAIFVDVAWLFDGVVLDALGVGAREEVDCDHEALVAALGAIVDDHSLGMPRLRTYWYDAAPAGSPTHEHERVASIPYVKVRIGRLSRSRQHKGVDVLIYLDLLRLARERAIGRAYLVTGDEDLRDAIGEAQSLGVQVVLVGPDAERGQRPPLAREADDFLRFPRKAWEGCFAPRDATRPAEEDRQVRAARGVGAQFARQWAARVAAEEVEAVLAGQRSGLPRSLDIELLVAAERELGPLRERPDLKAELRASFWFALREHRRAAEDGPSPPQAA